MPAVAALLLATSSGPAMPLVQAQEPTPTPTPLPTFIFTVTSTSDGADSNLADFTCNDGSGACTLRAAIQQANYLVSGNQPFKDTIRFNIPTSAPGYMTSTPTWWRIQPTSALPAITDPVVVDGYTQPGSSPNTNGPGLGLNTVLKIELDGSNSTGAGGIFNGLLITSGGTTVKGLAINRFLGGRGVRLETNGGNVLEGNFIGTDVQGTSLQENYFGNVLVTSNSNNNNIGGATPAARNLIAGSLHIVTNGNTVNGNLIGTDRSGTLALHATVFGVDVKGGSNNIIGGTTEGAANVVSGNDGEGIWILGNDAVGNIVQGNLIGTDVTGTVELGNAGHGVRISPSVVGGPTNNTIGGTATGAGNTIAFNGGDGVFAESGTGNAILGNSIFANTGLGIDLSPDGVTPNDAGDADTGPNNLQNFPVLAVAASGNGSIGIGFWQRVILNVTYRIEFFDNPSCDPSGYGEGQTILGFRDLGPFPSGADVGTFANFTVNVPVGHFITATTTDQDNNTSEFSQCLQVVEGIDFSISKTGSPNPVITDHTLTYSINLTNNGPSTATGVVVVDTLPTGTTFFSALASQGPGCVETGGVVTCDLGSLAVGATANMSIAIRAPLSAGTLINVASFSANKPDSTRPPRVSLSTSVVAVPTPTPTPVPSVSGLGLGVMAGLLLAASFWAYRRQRRKTTAASGR